MTPDALAVLHARAFAPERGWTSAEFSELCASPLVHLYSRPGGFALVRCVADEVELLTLAVAPEARRQGIADALMQDWMTDHEGRAFLEVAADNPAAQALYRKHGFALSGRRKDYYARPGAAAVDAVLMQAALTHRQHGQ